MVICACLTCANIYMKRQADEKFHTPSEALQSEILTVLRLKFCTIACNKLSLLSF